MGQSRIFIKQVAGTSLSSRLPVSDAETPQGALEACIPDARRSDFGNSQVRCGATWLGLHLTANDAAFYDGK